MSLPAGAQRLGARFVVERQFVEGGAGGVTYLARDEQTGRRVVVKQATNQDSAFQIYTEATALARIAEAYRTRGTPAERVPVPILVPPAPTLNATASDFTARVLLAEEYLDAPFEPLPALLQAGPLRWTPLVALQVAVALADLLVVAHGLGIVHGDLNERKLEHVFWDAGGRRLKVIDWGIAACPGLPWRGAHAPAADINGVGTLLRQMLAAARAAGTPAPAAEAIVRRAAVPPTQSGGFADAAELLAELERVLDAESQPVERLIHEAFARLRERQSRERDGDVRARLDEIRQRDPYRPEIRQLRQGLAGPDQFERGVRELQQQVGAVVGMLGAAADDPSLVPAAREMIGQAAGQARELGRLGGLLRGGDARTREVVDAALSREARQALDLDWARLTRAFEVLARGDVVLDARRPELGDLGEKLGALDVLEASRLLMDTPRLVQPPDRAADLAELFYGARFRSHPIFDARRIVDTARLSVGEMTTQAGLSGRAPSDPALDAASRALDAVTRELPGAIASQPFGETLDMLDRLAESVIDLAALNPGAAGFQGARESLAILERVRSRVAATRRAWHAGDYDTLGRGMDDLATTVPELAPILAAWRTGSARLAALGRAEVDLREVLERLGRVLESRDLCRESVARVLPGMIPHLGGAVLTGALEAVEQVLERALRDNAGQPRLMMLREAIAALRSIRQTRTQLADQRFAVLALADVAYTSRVTTVPLEWSRRAANVERAYADLLDEVRARAEQPLARGGGAGAAYALQRVPDVPRSVAIGAAADIELAERLLTTTRGRLSELRFSQQAPTLWDGAARAIEESVGLLRRAEQQVPTDHQLRIWLQEALGRHQHWLTWTSAVTAMLARMGNGPAEEVVQWIREAHARSQAGSGSVPAVPPDAGEATPLAAPYPTVTTPPDADDAFAYLHNVYARGLRSAPAQWAVTTPGAGATPAQASDERGGWRQSIERIAMVAIAALVVVVALLGAEVVSPGLISTRLPFRPKPDATASSGAVVGPTRQTALATSTPSGSAPVPMTPVAVAVTSGPQAVPTATPLPPPTATPQPTPVPTAAVALAGCPGAAPAEVFTLAACAPDERRRDVEIEVPRTIGREVVWSVRLRLPPRESAGDTGRVGIYARDGGDSNSWYLLMVETARREERPVSALVVSSRDLPQGTGFPRFPVEFERNKPGPRLSSLNERDEVELTLRISLEGGRTVLWGRVDDRPIQQITDWPVSQARRFDRIGLFFQDHGAPTEILRAEVGSARDPNRRQSVLPARPGSDPPAPSGQPVATGQPAPTPPEATAQPPSTPAGNDGAVRSPSGNDPEARPTDTPKPANPTSVPENPGDGV